MAIFFFRENDQRKIHSLCRSSTADGLGHTYLHHRACADPVGDLCFLAALHASALWEVFCSGGAVVVISAAHIGLQSLLPGANAGTEAKVVEIVLPLAGDPGSLAQVLRERMAPRTRSILSTLFFVRSILYFLAVRTLLTSSPLLPDILHILVLCLSMPTHYPAPPPFWSQGYLF